MRKKVLITAQWLEDVGTEIDVTFDKLSVTFSLECHEVFMNSNLL